eukprot:1148783-Pelagomonas_calceolata.AAC.3
MAWLSKYGRLMQVNVYGLLFATICKYVAVGWDICLNLPEQLCTLCAGGFPECGARKEAICLPKWGPQEGVYRLARPQWLCTSSGAHSGGPGGLSAPSGQPPPLTEPLEHLQSPHTQVKQSKTLQKVQMHEPIM